MGELQMLLTRFLLRAQCSSTGFNPRCNLLKMILHQVNSELKRSTQRNRSSYSPADAYHFH